MTAAQLTLVKSLLRVSAAAVLVLGGAHDLSDNVPKGVKLIVQTVQGYLRVIAAPEGTGLCRKIDAPPLSC